jgi:serine/threonine protein kinase
MICPACNAVNDDAADACFTCGRALGAFTQGSLIANRYEVLSPLGRGGMGMVYKAHDRMLDEPVAIKVLRAEFANTPEMAQRFRHEIKLARKVEGEDLKQLIRERGGSLEAEEAFELAVQIAKGLQAIHDVGIIHRDLKTSNIMRDKKGDVRLMDFGIAKVTGGDRSSGSGLTTTGQIMGTPEYMSPEQCLGGKLDHRSDIYALGVLVYEMFTGQVPFRGDTPVATLFKHIQDEPAFEGPVAGQIPLPAVAVLKKALHKDPAKRFQSAEELAAGLAEAHRKLLAEEPEDALPTSGMSPVVPAGPRLSTPTPTPAGERRRNKDTRLDIFVNFVLRRTGTLGTVLQEERTIAENISRNGARVMTTMSSLAPGDLVNLEEVGGPYKTRAEVRGTYVGKDGIRRLNLQLETPAPDYLVLVDDGGPQH